MTIDGNNRHEDWWETNPFKFDDMTIVELEKFLAIAKEKGLHRWATITDKEKREVRLCFWNYASDKETDEGL